jgi:hypothetical protein
MFFNRLKLVGFIILFYSLYAQGEIYQWVDSQGRTQFSDSPNEKYDAAGYARQQTREQHATTSGYDTDISSSKNLDEIAKELKQDRLKRKKLRDKESKARAKKNKQRKKQLAAAKKKKMACKIARDKEDLAFRQRSQRQGLVKMRKALANYEKKSDIRRKKCNN